MFQWDKSIKSLDVPVGSVVHLFRSMRDVQLALPGLPAQEASAYLCQYQGGTGIGTAAVFHLHKSGQLAFYVDSPREVQAARAEAVLDQSQVFVESMGFLMTDLDIHLLSESDRELLWSSLPLQGGVQPPEKSSAPASPRPVTTPAAVQGAETAPAVKPPKAAAPAVAEAGTSPGDNTPKVSSAGPQGAGERAAESAEAEGVDDLLAAVEALRTRRPGVRARKKTPSPEELKRRRNELRENLGRILASL